MNEERLNEMLEEFTKEELIMMLSSTIDMIVEKDKQEELILRTREFINSQSK